MTINAEHVNNDQRPISPLKCSMNIVHIKEDKRKQNEKNTQIAYRQGRGNLVNTHTKGSFFLGSQLFNLCYERPCLVSFYCGAFFHFRLFVFMNFCNCTTYCKVRIRISGFLTGGRSGGFLYSRRFLGLAIKCLLHCID